MPAPMIERLLFGSAAVPRRPVDVLLLGARLYAGVTIASAGFDKIPVPDWMVDQVIRIGFPAPAFFAHAACFTEFCFGLLLALGIVTRLSAFMLAFTMGVAAFGFHRVMPITGMHIAQGFFWLFVVFVAVGGGRLSVDHLVVRFRGGEAPALRRTALAVAPALALVTLAVATVFQLRPPPPAPSAVDVTIESVSVAGSFNGWDLAATPMTDVDGTTWTTTVVFEQAGSIEFKFAGNGTWDINVGVDEPGTRGFPLADLGAINGKNIVAYIPRAGTYTFSLDTETRAFSLDGGPAVGADAGGA